MGIVECVRCEKSYLDPSQSEDEDLCADCETKLQERLNELDREYTMKDDKDLSEREYRQKMNEMHKEKVQKVKFALSDVPPEHMPLSLAQMAEEICDPEVRDRIFCIGTIDEVKLGEKGVQLRDYYNPEAS